MDVLLALFRYLIPTSITAPHSLMLPTTSVTLGPQRTIIRWRLPSRCHGISQNSNTSDWLPWTLTMSSPYPTASTVARSKSNRAPLGRGRTGDCYHECAADRICSGCVTPSRRYSPTAPRNVFSTLLNLNCKELRELLGVKIGPSYYGTNKVCQIK